MFHPEWDIHTWGFMNLALVHKERRQERRGEERRGEEEGDDRKNWSPWCDMQAHTVTCSLACRWYQCSRGFGWITVGTNGPVTLSSTSLSYLTVARKQSSPSSQSQFLVTPRRWNWDWDNKIQRNRRKKMTQTWTMTYFETAQCGPRHDGHKKILSAVFFSWCEVTDFQSIKWMWQLSSTSNCKGDKC